MAIHRTNTTPIRVEVVTDDGWNVAVTVGREGRLNLVFGREDGSDFSYEQFPAYSEGDVALSLIPQPATAPGLGTGVYSN